MNKQINRKELKQKARQLLTAKGSKFLILCVAYVIVCLLLSALVSNILVLLRSVDANELMMSINSMSTLSEEQLMEAMEDLSLLAKKSYLPSLILSLLTSILFVGFISLILKAIRRQELTIGTLLDGFPVWWKIILMNICIGFVIFFACLLLVIPGIIAAYAYSMSHHILADNPEKGVIQCMRESRKLMKGYKFKLFVLELSFILWDLLYLVPFVGVVLRLWLTPYKETTRTLMYLQLKGESTDCIPSVTPGEILPPV